MLHSLLIIGAAFVGFFLVTRIFPKPKDVGPSFWNVGEDD